MPQKTILSFFLLCFASAFGFECKSFDDPVCFCDLLCGPHRFGIAPEIYYMERTRCGENPEDGWMGGERLNYERLKPWCLYYGAEQYYAVGYISRRAFCGSAFISKIQDAEVEGRFGYSMHSTWPLSLMVTPFVGYGNFTGTSEFIHPDFLKLSFHPRYNYLTYGFLSALYVCNGYASIGLNVKWKFMSNPINKVVDWSDNCHHCHTFYQRMGERTHIQIDIPVTYYYWCQREQAFELSIVPFYRNRIYGEHCNCPFDFLETKYEMWGGRIMIIYAF